MKDRLLTSLARLASEEYQDAFIVRGTMDEYVLPEDLVDDVESLCALALRNEYASEFRPEELVALGRMLAEIRRLDHDIFGGETAPTTATALIHDHPQWRALRSEAQLHLSTFRVQADDFVGDEIRQTGALTSDGPTTN